MSSSHVGFRGALPPRSLDRLKRACIPMQEGGGEEVPLRVDDVGLVRRGVWGASGEGIPL